MPHPVATRSDEELLDYLRDAPFHKVMTGPVQRRIAGMTPRHHEEAWRILLRREQEERSNEGRIPTRRY
jgi:hypothetical protein